MNRLERASAEGRVRVLDPDALRDVDIDETDALGRHRLVHINERRLLDRAAHPVEDDVRERLSVRLWRSVRFGCLAR